MKNSFIFLVVVSFLTSGVGYSQIDNIETSLEGQAIFTSNNQVPYWMWANQYGSIPLSGFSTSIIGSASKEYESTGSYKGRDSKLFDWGAGFEGRVNIGEETEAILIEAYAKARLAMFELKAGRSKDVVGLVDTTLTSGAFSISGNALGIPKIEISIPEFYALPFWDGLLAFKGNFAHGWLGSPRVHYRNDGPITTYFHQKSLYGRLGKADWRVHFYGGFNHNAFWGNTKDYIPSFKLSDWQEYWYTVTGKVNNFSKTGNHLGSIDLGLQYDFDKVSVFGYRQQFYDIGGLYHLSNIADGLNGLSIRNNSKSRGSFKWDKFLFEFLYTKSQGGELKAKITPSGDENYYNSYIYAEGWSYNHVALGTPLITTTPAAREGQVSDESDYFLNNRVVAFHLGFQGSLYDWNILSKLTYSQNYGTYGSSPIGHSLNTRRSRPYGLFEKVNQFSGYLEAQKAFSDNWNFGLVLAVDQGKLYNESIGAILKANYNF